MLLTAGAAAQSAVDALNVTPTQLRGTARFVSMGGAFTSLGGDISCMTQNPAGLAMYRYSDLGLTFDISFRNYKNVTNQGSFSQNETRATFDNFGYVGVTNLTGAMRTFQWGISYNRIAKLDRMTSNYVRPTNTSLSNYIASYTNGVSSDYLIDDQNGPDPFEDPDNDWLSVLAYNSFMINNTTSADQYAGLFQNGTDGDAQIEQRERGYMDEYNIDFAGNVSDVVYWGVGVGITDLNYTLESAYSESMAGARIYDDQTRNLTTGNGYFNLYNWKTISGTGANIKLGVIVRPLDQLRIGFAVHTPTWMHLSHTGYGDVTQFNYTPDGSDQTLSNGYSTPDYDFKSRLTSPWRFMMGISGVIGGRAILSADYERVAYPDMKMKEQSGLYDGFRDNTYANQDIKSNYQAANIFRIGAEIRLDNNWSARAGYNWQGSSVKQEAKAPGAEIFTHGTAPDYTFFGDTQNFSLGLGYRYGNWYADLAWQFTRKKGEWHAYTDFDGLRAPSAAVTDTYNNIVISTGFRF